MIFNSLNKQKLNDFIISQAKALGFFDCGISKAEHLTNDEARMEQWLTAGNNGEMSYLERNREKRYNPELLVENAKSIVTVLFNYYPNRLLEQNNNYKISKYAYGVDYHHVIKEKLRELLSIIENKTGKHNSRVFVDSAPVLDRAWARKSNLGFIGKNTMLINKKGGSFFFIGHIITSLELHYEVNEEIRNYCGTCTRCIDACPTSAIKDNYVDARSCLSYLTIEYNGSLNSHNKELFNNWIFGCDICQDVCPWNRFSSPNDEKLFEPNEKLLKMDKPAWDSMDKIRFNELFKGSAVHRTRYNGLKRNIDFLKGLEIGE
jgi:epoxyqueuosine reductase